MGNTKGIHHAIAGARARLGGVAARHRARRLRPADATLASVRQALLSKAPEEEVWATRIEGSRASLEGSLETITFETGSPDWWQQRAVGRESDPHLPLLEGNTVTRVVSEITRSTSKPEEWGRFFYRLVRALKPERCLELGTSVGMSALYLSAGLTANNSGRLVTIDGLRDVGRIARAEAERVGVADRVEMVTGRFADELPHVLERLGGVDLAFIDGHHLYEPTKAYFDAVADTTAAGGLLLFDDVYYWHEGMEQAWREIRADPRVTGSLTVNGVGLAVVGGEPACHASLARLPLL